MLTLGIETSCDETAASVVRDADEILSNTVASSIDYHREFGGIIPEIAQRFHLRFIDRVAAAALKEAGVGFKELDLIGVTRGPGLAGALLVGVSYAKALSLGLKRPLVGVNHLQAHIHAALMQERIDFPFIGLVVSGGHTLLALVKDYDDYELLGQTQDDAAGEAFDKVAKLLEAGYPGGPEIEKLALLAKEVVDFPRPYLDKASFDFSFSGLKTAVLYYIRDNYKNSSLNEKARASIAAGFQASVIDVLTEKSLQACLRHNLKALVVGGGVSKNQALRARLKETLGDKGIRACFPEGSLCLDNAAMIAGLAYQLHLKNQISGLDMAVEAGLNI